MQARILGGQRQAAFCWNLCRALHMEARHRHEKWPGRDSLQKATKGGLFALHSQSIQMVVHAFLANVDAAQQLRAQGQRWIRYPYRDKRFFPLMWPAQAMAVEKTRIVLPMGRGRCSLILPRPKGLPHEGAAAKIVWNGVGYELHWTVETSDAEPVAEGALAAGDLGQIHQIAVVTNTGDALIVSGRGIRSVKRRRNKALGTIQQKQSRCRRGSRRWKKLNRAKAKVCVQTARQVRDLRHKGARAAVNFCRAHDVRSLYVGNPDGVRKNRSGRHHNQRMSQWEYGRDLDYIEQKTKQAGIACFSGTERGTSSCCPICGHRHKPRGRVWQCIKCGFIGHRDLVGGVNMHLIAYGQPITFPHRITYLRPGVTSVAQATGMNSRSPGSSSRPDTGQAYWPVAAPNSVSEPAGLPEPPRGQGRKRGRRSEAHLL